MSAQLFDNDFHTNICVSITFAWFMLFALCIEPRLCCQLEIDDYPWYVARLAAELYVRRNARARIQLLCGCILNMFVVKAMRKMKSSLLTCQYQPVCVHADLPASRRTKQSTRFSLCSPLPFFLLCVCVYLRLPYVSYYHAGYMRRNWRK